MLVGTCSFPPPQCLLLLEDVEDGTVCSVQYVQSVCVCTSRTYLVDSELAAGFEVVGHWYGCQSAHCDGCPEDTGQITGRFMGHRQRLSHSVRVHKPLIGTLMETQSLSSALIVSEAYVQSNPSVSSIHSSM